MTVLEALNAEVNNQTLSSKYLVLVGLEGALEYASNNNSKVELAKAYCFKAIVTQPDFGEDGLSVQYDRKYLIEEANRIFLKNDLQEQVIGGVAPKVSDKTGLW